MRFFFLLITVFLSPFFLTAQPAGVLYVQHHQQQPGLAYLSYPSEQYTFIDSVRTSDLIASDQYLYAASASPQL